METTPAFYDINTFAYLTSKSRSGIYDLLRRGLVRCVVIGSDRRIPASELDRLLKEGAPNGVPAISDKCVGKPGKSGRPKKANQEGG